jgi:signal transduction histidine kinase
VTPTIALAENPGVRPDKAAIRSDGRFKQEARALGAAQNREADADALTIAGQAMQHRGVPLLRLLLSAAALLIIWFDPSEPDRHVQLTYGTLAAYTLYSAVVYFAASLYKRALPKTVAHWIDLAWHTLLVSISSGTNSLFFFFYFFDILVASLQLGAREGLRVTVASAILFIASGIVFSPVALELNRFLMRALYLLVLGYMMASLGGLEIRLRRRLAVLREVTVLSNPRFGVDQTITSALEKLRAFYDADDALLVIAGESMDPRLYQARRGDAGHPAPPDKCAPELAAMLLSPPFSHAMLVEQDRNWWRPGPFVHIEDVTTQRKLQKLPVSSQVVISALDAPAIITVPFQYHHEAVGRLYIVGRGGAFDLSDLEFLSHAIHAMVRVTDNVRLVDNLAFNAAENERRRIARGIHDTVIQPFIGVQIGLRAIRERLDDADYHAGADIEHLAGSIDAEVYRLRQYVTNLKGEQRSAFMPAIRRFAREYRRLTGIDVEVKGPVDMTVSERVCVELFGMTAEALSNIRRHTTSLRAAIVVERVADRIEFRIENNDTNDAEAPPFNPRSLGEHAAALGGSLEVRRSPGTTAVVVNIPL